MTKKNGFDNINYAFVAKAHTQLYLMHKYWARKPHNVVREYVEHYTKKGEVVLDPFCGSGVTAIEALRAGRKAIAVDLNPMAIFITEQTLEPVDIPKIDAEFRQLEQKLRLEINGLYKTTCTKCKSAADTLATIWNKGKDAPEELRYYCPMCRERRKKKPDEEDLKLLKKIEKSEIKEWYPQTPLKYDGVDFKEGTHEAGLDRVDLLFTRRNLAALAKIFAEINKIQNKRIREIFRFAFTSMVHLASKMTPDRPTRPYSSFWAVHRYWVPPQYMESNVWRLFESVVKGKQGIIVGKVESNHELKNVVFAKDFDELKKGANSFVKLQNVLELEKSVPPNSVDYIFTDPPYGGAVQYFELSTLWASWLGFELKYDDEITVNENQKKNFDYYHNMLKAAFRQMYRVLKPGKILTVTFHSTDIKVWNSILKAVVLSGFDLEKIVYQPPARPSAKGLLQPYGSAVGDYYMRFIKPEKEHLASERQIDEQSYEREVIFAAQRIIQERGEPTIYQHILNGIMVELNGGRDAPIGAKGIEDVLKSSVGKEFELIEEKDGKGKKVRKWWIKDASLTRVRPALTERLDRAIIDVLKRKVKVSFDDILQEIFIQFPNAQTPETERITSSLSEYAEKTKDGMWRLKPKVQERESQHSKMIYVLAELGKKCGYEIWIGLREQGDSYEGRKLKTLCDFEGRPHIRLGIGEEEMERIKQIDVIWIDRARPIYEFEVENTTGITEAFVRGSNLPQNVYPLKRYIVIPEEREPLLRRKVEEPLLKESLKNDNWHFIFYDQLLRFFDKNRRKGSIKPEEIDALAGKLKTDSHKQGNLSEF